MAAALQINVHPLTHQHQFHCKPISKHSPKWPTIRCAAATATPSSSRHYTITLLPGDGIGPEVISVAKTALQLAGSLEGIEFGFKEMPMGGAALDLTGVPLPEDTLSTAQQSDAVLLGAIGGYKWDNNEKHLKPETGLLQLRKGLKVFANLRPATVLPQLVEASTLNKEVAEGVDLMVVRELTGVFILDNQGVSAQTIMARKLVLTPRCMLLMRLIALLESHLKLLGNVVENSVLLIKQMCWRHQCLGGRELQL